MTDSDPRRTDEAADDTVEPDDAATTSTTGTSAKGDTAATPAKAGTKGKNGRNERSGNPAKAAAAAPRETKLKKPQRIGNRWAAPAMLISAGIGLLWIVAFYTAGDDLPVMKDLDNWNLVIGMGFIVAAFGFSMKWE